MIKGKLLKIIISSFVGICSTALFFTFLNNSNSKSQADQITIAESVDDYYSNVDWSETGAALKTALFDTIKISNPGWSYSGLWEAYKTTDKRANGTLWDIYSDTTQYVIGGSKQGASYSAEGDAYNREHVIPQSVFSEKSPMKSDAHHVLPSDGYVNNRRSNYPHGNVKSASYTSNDGCKLGTSNVSGYSGTVFEPMSQYKGDIARIYFYFVTCYQDKIPNYNFGAFSKNTFPSINSAFLSVYLQWAKDDPVSQKEIDRNNVIYATQHNRNPFVDYPYAIGAIWDPDNVSDYGSQPNQNSNYLRISKTAASLSLDDNNTTTISATSSNGSSITWTNSSPSVASISSTTSNSGTNITITALEAGTTTLTATAIIDNETYTKTCVVTVSSSGGSGGGGDGSTTYVQLTSISNIDGTAKYVLGVDGVGFHYSGTSSWGSTALPSAQTPLYYTLTKGSGSTSFTASTKIDSTTYYLTVPTSNTFTMSTSSENIKLGTTTNDSSGTPSYAVANTSTQTRHLRINGTSGLRSYAGTTGTMAYFYKVVESTPTTEPILSSISLSGQKTTFTVGDTFSFDGIVTATYSDSSTDDVTDSTTFSGYNMSTAGTQEVTASYTEGGVTKTAKYNITVNQQQQPTSDVPMTANGDFIKITSITNLVDGEYLIVYESGNLAFNGGLSTLDATGNKISITISNSTISATSSVLAATFTYNSTDKTLKSKSGYYIGQNSNANGLASSTSVAYQNTITIDGSGNANIVSSGGAYLRYNSGSDQNRFRYYKSSSYTDQQPVQLYLKTTSWGASFLSSISCNNGVTAPSTTNWATTKTNYLSMTTNEQNKVKSATANENGTDLQKAIARYTYIVNKYTNRTNYPDYLNKASQSNMMTPIQNNSVTTILVAISALSILSGMTLVIWLNKKKKEN